MPESEGSGESVLDDPVDTDQLGVQEPPTPEPDDEFDYLLGTPEREPEPESDTASPQPPGPEDPNFTPFDAFNASTWRFKPAPVPWYRTRPAVAGITAVAIALVALVVAVVLLAFRQPADDEVPAPRTSTTPATATPTTVTATSSALPPPPPPPPPPPVSAPAGGGGGGPVGTRPTKKPEINVTRKPISVRPQPRGQG